MRLTLLPLLAAALAPANPCFAAPYSLFDGSFNGWEGDTKNTWRIEEGAFTAGSTDRMQPRNEFLATKKEFGDFELSIKWKLTGTEGFVNGGVQFRTKRIPNHHEVSGYQADLGAGTDGSLYDESRRNKMLAQPAKDVLEKARKPLGEWNEYRIRAEGPRIQLWLNGVPTVDFTETDPKIPRTGIIAVQIHGNAKSQVWYKDIVIEELGKKIPPDPTHPADPKAVIGPVQQRFADPLPAPPREPFKDGKFEIRPGEVIVFTGGTTMVLESQRGYLEAALTLKSPEVRPVFRNMAWEGDTVFEQWRDQNFGSWKDQLDAVNATCVFVCFGQMEALDESRPIEDFRKAFAALVDEFRKVTPRVVVLAPPQFDLRNLPRPKEVKFVLPVWKKARERLEEVKTAMEEIAGERQLSLLDLEPPPDYDTSGPPRYRTPDGIHWNDSGNLYLARRLFPEAGLKDRDTRTNELCALIATKNRLWHDCWKTMNWAFAYSDRTEQPFGKGIGNHPPMAKELEQYKSLIREADARIHAFALNKPLPPPAEKPAALNPPAQSPEVEQKTFKVRDGFEANLFASEADGLVKPLSMRWDHRGRLWAACSPSYPQLVPGEPRRDYILVCEDTNADGKADKFHKFADELTMPMGIEFGDGGVYVCESTQLVFLRDSDGDGKADWREVILSGFGTGDSHQMINSLRWGPDGCLWFSQGLHIFSRIETPWGIVRFDRAGLWRFNPRTWKLQGFFGNAAAGANCWGVTFDDWGQVFHCAADNNPGFYTTPGLGTWANPPSYYNIGSLAVSPVKGMCMEYVNSTHLPPELQGALCKPVYFANQVLLYKLVEDGSGYKTEDLGPLLTSSSNAFRPLGVQTGPDGALYVCDWYNPVIGHYQASYRDPNRDKLHGRIWRVTAKGRPLAKRPDLEKMDAGQLLGQLRSPERWVRDQARRLLFFEEDAVKLIEAEAAKADASPEFLFECLAVLAAHEQASEAVLERCLTSPDARLRAFAVRIASVAVRPSRPEENDLSTKAGTALLQRAVNDPHPRVRLEAAVAASYFQDAGAMEVACRVLDQPHDRFIDYALANTVRALKPQWSKALGEGTLTFGGNPSHLAFVLKVDGAPAVPQTVRNIIQKGSVTGSALADLLALLVKSGGPDDLTFAIEAAGFESFVVSGLIAAADQRAVRPSRDFKAALATKTGSLPPAARLNAYDLAIAWGDAAAMEKVKLIATGTGRTEERLRALDIWMRRKGAAGMEVLREIINAGHDALVTAGAVKAMATFDAPSAAGPAADWLRQTNKLPESAMRKQGIAEILRGFLAVRRGPELLSAALSSNPPDTNTAGLLLEALATAGRDEPALTSVLRKAAGLPDTNAVPGYSAEFVASLITEAKASGDARRGAAVFAAPQAACAGCHKVGETGGITGPDLTAIGRGMTPELITESVIWPKRQIKEGFFLTTVTTHDGKIITGYKQSDDEKSLVLRAPGLDLTNSISRDQIKERSDTGTLMPENLTAWMTPDQRRDLLKYLFELGK